MLLFTILSETLPNSSSLKMVVEQANVINEVVEMVVKVNDDNFDSIYKILYSPHFLFSIRRNSQTRMWQPPKMVLTVYT